jgi:hypothetical protein
MRVGWTAQSRESLYGIINYLVVYRATLDAIEILYVLHAHQQY